MNTLQVLSSVSNPPVLPTLGRSKIGFKGPKCRTFYMACKRYHYIQNRPIYYIYIFTSNPTEGHGDTCLRHGNIEAKRVSLVVKECFIFGNQCNLEFRFVRMESRIDVIATVKNFDRYFNKGRLHDQIIPRLSVFPIMTLLIIQHIWHANFFFLFACFFFGGGWHGI